MIAKPAYFEHIMVDILSLDEKTNWEMGGVMDWRAWMGGTVSQTWEMGGSIWCGVAVYGGHMKSWLLEPIS